MMIDNRHYEKAAVILCGHRASPNPEIQDLGAALALLTSPVKAERELGKQLVRDWRRAGEAVMKEPA